MSKSVPSRIAAIITFFTLYILTIVPVLAITKPVDSIKPAAGKEVTPVGKIRLQKETAANRLGNKVDELKEKIASRTAAFNAKLDVFKDRKKAEVAERVNNNLNRINLNQTGQMQKHLNTMSKILERLEVRVNSGKPDIKDPAAARAAIVSAKTTIATASAAIAAQAQKDYTIQVTSESRVKADAKLQRDKLHTDLQSIRKIVIDAKQSVADAIRVAKAGSGKNDSKKEKEGTGSGRQ